MGRPRKEPRPQPVSTADLVASKKLWPIKLAAAQLGVGRVTLYGLHKRGEITFVKVGARTFVTDAELDRFVANLTHRGEIDGRATG